MQDAARVVASAEELEADRARVAAIIQEGGVAYRGLALNLNFVHPKLGTPLFIACRFGQEKLVSRMLDLGADPNLVAEDGRSAFYVASEISCSV